jgi:AcrR family transcriptional regulator
MARPRGDIRERVLTAGKACFEKDGVEGASLREVARQAHTSIGMIYYYFPTKDDLFLAVVEEVYAALLHDLETAFGVDAAHEERLRRVYLRLGALTDQERSVIRLVAREALVSSQRFERIMERFRRGHVPLVLEFVSSGLRGGVLRQDLHPFVAMACVLSVGGLAQTVLGVLRQSIPLPATEAVTEQLLSVVWRGLTQPPSPASPG